MKKTYTMYASGLIRSLVCDDCENKPCPYKSWLQKNSCPTIVAYCQNLGKCCATCLHCMWGEYCTEKVPEQKKHGAHPDEFLIDWDIFEHVCEAWTNSWVEE